MSAALQERFPDHDVSVSKGARNSFEVTIDGDLKWSGLTKGPPRTEKWNLENILEAVGEANDAKASAKKR